MGGRLTRTNCDEAGDYAGPNVLSPRDLVPDLTIWTKLYYHHLFKNSQKVLGYYDLYLHA